MSEPVYRLPDLPYDYDALEPHISAEIMRLHHDKHHAAYVAGANTALEKLAAARVTGDFSTITKLEKDLAFHLSGHVLHSVFWQNLGPQHDEPQGALLAQLERDFGGVDAFRSHLLEAANTVQGSGWAVAAWEPLAQRIVVTQVYDHQGNVAQGAQPLLVVDAWEHAWYLQYKNVKADFFDAVWNVVHWADVAHRLEQAKSARSTVVPPDRVTA
jgi:Fe-Mn family superoxide dismutase